MTKILNHDKPLDILICTGKTRSVEDFCRITFEKLDLDYKQFVISDPKYYRPNELPYLKGDPSRMKEILGWEPETAFEEMIDEMIIFWMHYHLTGQMKFDIV
jgi:GDPmannose 4,6-dehydratase